MQWKDYTKSDKWIFISLSMVYGAMFLNWIDTGIYSSNGFSQGAYILLLLWIYPLYKFTFLLKINKIIGVVYAMISLFVTWLYIMGKPINYISIGVYMFLFASVILIIGLYLQKE